MLLTPTQARSLYEHAVTNRYAILAVNADSPAAVVDCLLAAKACDAPIIVETSLWQLTGHSFGAGDPFLGIDLYLAMLSTLASSDRFAEVPVVYHTDHIKGPGTLSILEHALEKQASSISLDSSELSPEENVAMLSRLCQSADSRGLDATLEMEAGVDDGVTPLEEVHSLVGRIETLHPGRIALWAPGVGTCHGLGSDPEAFSPEAVHQHHELASELTGRPIGIALHGSSGLDETRLSAAVQAGVAKVNWSSESLLIRSQAARSFYEERGKNLEKGSPDFKETAMDNGVQSHVSQCYLPRVRSRIETLGGKNQASSFRNLVCLLMTTPRAILVTGAAGSVATAIRPLLRDRYEWVVLTDQAEVTDLEAGEEFLQGELEDLAFLEKAARDVDGILHLGGKVGAHYTFEETFGSNIIGTHRVFEAAVSVGVPRVVYASSHHAVGFTPRGKSIDHLAPLRPDGEYGLSKAYGEAAASYFVDNFDLSILSIRIGYVGGDLSTERRLHTWVSARDLVQLIHLGFTFPDLRHEIVYGVSGSPGDVFDNTNAFRLGYLPQDRAVDQVEDSAVLQLEPDLGTIEEGVIGGGFASVGFAGKPEHVLHRS